MWGLGVQAERESPNLRAVLKGSVHRYLGRLGHGEVPETESGVGTTARYRLTFMRLAIAEWEEAWKEELSEHTLREIMRPAIQGKDGKRGEP